MVYRIISWLENKKILTVILLACYFLVVVLPHEIIAKIIVRNLDIPLGRDRYNEIIMMLAIGGLVGYLAFFFYGFRHWATERKKAAFYLMATLVMIILSINILMVVNVEIIHIVQYAACSLLLFPILKNYGSTLFWIAILGSIDEAYQYFVLSPHRTDYFDFNDVIIDILGGGLGLVFLKASGVVEKNRYEIFRSPIVVGSALLTLGFTYLFRHEYLAVYPNEQIGGLPLLLIKRIEENFWTFTDTNIKFHIIQPLEGLLIIIGMVIFYKFLGKQKEIIGTPELTTIRARKDAKK